MFEHQQLESDHIRLLEPEPSHLNDFTLKCKLSPVALSTARYTALSYYWGDPIEPCQILVNDEVFALRPNLWWFLREARSHTQPLYFWVDATCINQVDLEERNQQVRLISKIPKNARSADVWLGQSLKDGEGAFSFVQQAFQLGLSSAGKRGRHIALVDLFRASHRKAFVQFCQRDYWKRTWIIQEFITASEITIRCGTKDNVVGWAL